jgi:tetratricopeptide (TPR) repeat protein
MRLALRGSASLAFALALFAPRSMAAQDDGHDLFRGGKYQQAIAALNKVPASDSDWAASQRDLVRAYAAVGKYDEAEAAGRRAVLSPKGGIVWNPLGEVLITRGKRAAAESAFVRARSTPDSLIASLNLAVLHYDRGDRDQAMKEFDKFIDVYNRSLGNELTSDDLMAVAIACEYLGENDPQLFHDAQKAYDRATTVDPSNDAAKIRLGELFLRKYNFEEAQKAFEEVLQTNPNDPRDAELYATLAELAADVRLYKSASDFARQGVALDAKDWHAWSVLGMNQLRLGQIDTGRASLDKSFKGDPYNVWVKNTLDLLDTYKNYDLTTSPRFQFMIEKDESPILAIYLRDLAEQAYTTFEKKYAYTPPPPVRIEVYRSHADFSVRTVGLAGLGALGVSFGTTLAFDSPAAKDAGPFNWGSTVWHELAHTFTLGSTDNRIPRWLSEGLSVYEEHHARPGWGFGVTPDFLAAYKAGKLVPVSRMNDGFMHPAYPEQVQFSYYQASLVCELIARDFGEPAILRMLQAYKDGQTTDQVFQKVLNTDLKSFDKRFDTYLNTRFGPVLASMTKTPPKIGANTPVESAVAMAATSPNDFGVQLFTGEVLITHNDLDRAIPYVERAREIFPEYGGDDSPYAVLAMLYQKKGDQRKEADALVKWTSLTETNLKALERLATLLEQLGDAKGAADALDRAMFVNPFDVGMHQKLAELSRAAGDKQRTVRERAAIVALGPVDKAAALYELALAQHEAGDDAHARTSVLRSLEEAPNFEKAQTLLLTLYDARTKQAGEKRP